MPAQQTPATSMLGVSQKSKIAAGLLGIFLGCFGIHNFYLGYNVKGGIQLGLTVLGCATGGLTTLVASIWGLVEGIIILTSVNPTDAQGLTLRS